MTGIWPFKIKYYKKCYICKKDFVRKEKQRPILYKGRFVKICQTCYEKNVLGGSNG